MRTKLTYLFRSAWLSSVGRPSTAPRSMSERIHEIGETMIWVVTDNVPGLCRLYLLGKVSCRARSFSGQDADASFARSMSLCVLRMQASTGSRPGSAGGAGVGRPPVQEAGRRLGPSCVAFGELGRREGKVLLGEPFRARQLAYLRYQHGRYRQAVQAHRPPSQDCEPPRHRVHRGVARRVCVAGPRSFARRRRRAGRPPFRPAEARS